MSQIAPEMAIQIGTRLPEIQRGSPGIPLAEGTPLACGMPGPSALGVAPCMGAYVTVFDINHDRLKSLDDIVQSNRLAAHANACSIERPSGRAGIAPPERSQ